MANLSVQRKNKAKHTLLCGIDTTWTYNEYVVAKCFRGIWYTATIYAGGNKMYFREIDENKIKNMLFLFNGSGMQVNDFVFEKLSNFLAKSIYWHLHAKSNMDNFFSQIEESKA